MEIFINNHASVPIYEQISSQIKALIMSGELKAGEALPFYSRTCKIIAY